MIGLTIAIIINIFNKPDNTDEQRIAQGVEIIKKLEKQDVIQVEEQIEAVRTQNGINDNNNNVNNNSTDTDYKSKFESSAIAGDSRAEGIYSYGVLNQSSVVAQKGRNLITATKNGDIDTLIGMYPKNIFFTYGINDVLAYRQSDTFIKIYGEVIDKVKSKLPNTNIYVSSILPVTASAANKQTNFKNIDAWNNDLKALCEEKNVTYLDAGGVIQQSYYAQDGIHFNVNGIKKWLDLFIQSANL